MAKRALKKTNENPAPKIAKKSFYIFKKALIFIGKPAFFILSNTFIAILFIFYITGHSFRTFLNLPSVLLKKNIKKSLKFYKKLNLPKIKLPKISFKITLPRIKPLKIKVKLPQLHFRYLFVLILFFLFLVIPFNFIVKVFKDLPSPQKLTQREIEVSTKIYDRNGVLLYKIFENKNRTIIPLQEIPMHVRLATLAAEDAEFYSHPGFSIKGIVRAVYKNLTQGELTGGSTITQQLVKNALLTSEKTWVRKAKEITLALQVEMSFTKDQILEMYLNEVSYGGTAYGIEEASIQYFNKDVGKLTLAQASLLAGLPKSPTKYSPSANPSLSLARQKEVLHLMKVNGFINEEQEKQAGQETLTFANQKTDIKAPHFVMYVRQILEETYGKEMIGKGGLNVITSLDYEIQKLAEDVVAKEIEKLKPLNVTNGAVVVLNPATGEILAMVGSYNYFDNEHDGNVNVTLSERQPGSSIKIINYAYALSHGYTPSTIIPDIPTSFLVEGQPPYIPKNYDGNYRGNLLLRSAFAESRNIPAVRVLASYGVKNMIEMGKKMGITTWDDENRFGLSLTLGGGEVKLLDLARVYATVANYGKRPEISPIINITNYQNGSVYLNPCLSVQTAEEKDLTKNVYASEVFGKNCREEAVLDPRVAYILTDILKDNSARAPAFGTFSQLVIPNHKEVAVKTGTSNNLRDNLTIGYNQKYLVAVWVGNNDNSPMARVASGVTGASPIFNKIMSSLLFNEQNHDWTIPEGLIQIPVCKTTGTLSCSGCETKMEWFLGENKPQTNCETSSPKPHFSKPS
ncbi:hypothetical protein A2W13_02895 [Candidatus Woesebacteria bacterium RBG_16_36_11]|uniref:Uncharacterized protein n=3 Tax=Candidatus Woeseibacteriota TaxID=1752722 RepID=A0A1F7X9R3_9BACT|nr:MAG: hypothetical protein A2Z67_05430 [Candidatus Woesebacteria bacterium RBG_13_36_22]OGM11108.1 MAG: hypothetical protein A2W13_02895 [Candidatus Woesebacteria bacterium RBG_16_36_11]OGM16594.1 MAG: hypothetical protein A2V55_00525 [Candidatus Woesebacteria bacterium RBG_19FT_COMBO_37_29]